MNTPVLVCQLCDAAPAQPSVQSNCWKCDAPVWVPRASVEIQIQENVCKFECEKCFDDNIDTMPDEALFQLMTLSPELKSHIEFLDATHPDGDSEKEGDQ
jgi:hypothetical protein